MGYRRAYGARKTWKELKRRRVPVGRDRVARLMRQEGLVGYRRGRKHRTTIPDEAAVERARDLLQRDFTGPGIRDLDRVLPSWRTAPTGRSRSETSMGRRTFMHLSLDQAVAGVVHVGQERDQAVGEGLEADGIVCTSREG